MICTNIPSLNIKLQGAASRTDSGTEQLVAAIIAAFAPLHVVGYVEN
jgi:hypothetical protein